MCWTKPTCPQGETASSRFGVDVTYLQVWSCLLTTIIWSLALDKQCLSIWSESSRVTREAYLLPYVLCCDMCCLTPDLMTVRDSHSSCIVHELCMCSDADVLLCVAMLTAAIICRVAALMQQFSATRLLLFALLSSGLQKHVSDESACNI